MAIELTYDKQHQYITARVHGYLSIEDIQNFMNEVLSSEEMPSDANTLWDITQMEFDNIDLDLQTKIVELRKKFNIERGNAKIAIVSNYQLGDILVKLFLVLMEEVSQEVKAFRNSEQAISWFEQA